MSLFRTSQGWGEGYPVFAMGFDLKARRPKKKSQTWFGCGTFWWGPLWEFVVRFW